MTVQSAPAVRRPRLRRLLRLIEGAPAPVVLVVGIVVLFFGIFIVTRPLTSLWLLAVLVGVSAIVAGIIDLADSRRSAQLWSRIVSVVWIIGGLAVLVWLGRSIELLPTVLGLLLIVGGVGSLAAVGRGRVSERVLAVASGVGQMVFGGLALLWPDLTLLIAAVLFGIRTVVYGASLVWRAGRRLAGKPARLGEGARTRRGLLLADAARYALAVGFVVLAGSAWWVNSWLADGSPVVDSFYDAPETLPDERGELIRSDDYAGVHPAGGTVRRILYSTTDRRGVRAVAS
ncbi:MAG TPA: DUF308 domain-containing protein, partial [Microbacterium sp.]|nr:DUF308 domain-containing protein [Microbacterium sp.]